MIPSKVEIALTVKTPESVVAHEQVYFGQGATVRVAAMRAIEKAMHVHGPWFRKGSEKRVDIVLERTK